MPSNFLSRGSGRIAFFPPVNAHVWAMMRGRGPGLMVSALLLNLVAGAGAWAQQREGLHFGWPIEVELARESGLPVSDSTGEELLIRTVDDTVLTIRPPAPSVWVAGRRLELEAIYQPEFEVFLENSDLGKLNHAAGVRLGYQLTRRLEAHVGDLFRHTYDRSDYLGPSTLLLVRGLFRQNTFFTGLTYRANRRTTLEVRFDDVRSSFDAGAFAILPRRVSRIWEASLSHRIGSRDSLAVVYSLLDASAPEAPELLDDPDPFRQAAANGYRATTHNLSLGYRRELSRSVALEGSGGLIRGAAAQFYSASARLDVRLRRLRFLTGYDRGLSHRAEAGFPGEEEPGFTSEVVPDSLLQAVWLRFGGQLSARSRMDLQGWVSRRTPSSVELLETREFDSLSARARFDYWVAERLSLYGGVEIQTQDASFLAGAPIDRRSVLVGVRFGPTIREAERSAFMEGGPELSR